MNEKDAKYYVLNLAVLMSLLSTILLSAAYILDPFQIFHASYFVKDRYARDFERFQNAGVIAQMMKREDCCDTVIIGTSYSQNFLPSHVEKTLSGKGILQMSLSGSLPSEQKILHEQVTKSGEIKNVIWDVHNTYAEDKVCAPNDPEILQISPGKFFPQFLYDENRLNDYFYLASIDVFFRFKYLIAHGKSYEKYQSWYDEARESFGKGKELGLTDTNFSEKTAPATFDAYKFPNIDDILLPTIKNHPDQEFLLFLPPYSRHFYATMAPKEFTRMMNMRYALAQALKDYPNAKIFSFDEWSETADLDNYKDLGHFSADMSKKIIQSMKDGKDILTAPDTKAHIGRLTDNVNLYIRQFKAKQDHEP